MPTSEDIAKYLGISRGTVSRALNNHGRISEDTRKKVLAAVAELEYEPNRAARALVGLKPIKSAISLFDKPAYFWNAVKEGLLSVHDDLKHFGFTFEIVENRIEDPAEQETQLMRLYDSGVRAVAVAPNDPVLLDRVIRKLSGSDMSVITFNVDIPSKERICYLGCDYTKAGRLAGDTLARLLPDKARIAAFSFAAPILTVTQRMEGFLSVVREYSGLSVVPVSDFKRNGDGAYEHTLAFLRENPDIDGIYVSFGILEEVAAALETTGQGGTIRLVGYDLSQDVERYIRSGVIDAAICHDPLMQGFYAARLLYNLAALGRRPPNSVIHTKLDIVMRENLDSHTDELNRLSVLRATFSPQTGG